MRYDNLKSFYKHVQGQTPEHLLKIYLLISKNSHDLSEATATIIKRVFPEGRYSDLEVQLLPENVEMGTLLDELNTISLFAKKRIILLRHADKLNKHQIKMLMAYLEKPNPQIYFLITADSFSKASDFYKKAEKTGAVLDIPEEKSWQKEKNIRQWLKEEIIKEGLQIDAQALELLVKQVGLDQNLLDQEIGKLHCYLGDRSLITLEDVRKISSCSNAHSIWELGEAIFALDSSKALVGIKSLLTDTTQLIGLLRQLRSQFQTMLQISSILAAGKSRDEISHHYRYLTGNLLNKKVQEAQTYGLQKLKKGLLEIDQTELKAKNGLGDPHFLAEILMIKLTTK